jgi:AsmA-like C-terminal region/AsmA family
LKKLFKYLGRFLLALLLLVFLLSMAGLIYVKTHKASILSYIKTASARQLNGEVLISDINAGLLHTFPSIAITLRDIRVRDSAWKTHHHDLLRAGSAFATIDLFSLLTGRLTINKLILENATIDLFTDSTGYNNTSIFKKRSGKESSGQNKPSYPLIELRNSRFLIEKEDKHKLFSFDVPRLLCHVVTQEDNGNLDFDVSLSAFSHGLSFNPSNGPFLEEQPVEGRFAISFNPRSKILQFENILLKIARQPVQLSGKFFLAEVPAPFVLTISAENLPYKTAATFISRNVRRKLDQYGLDMPVSKLVCSLDNSEPEYKTPLIHLTAEVRNTGVTTPAANFDHASFVVHFTNELVKGLGHDDDNSELRFTAFSGTWQQMKMHCDSVIITGLTHPYLRCNLKSDLEISNVNGLLDDRIMSFDRGHASLNLLYGGPLDDSSLVEKDITGTIGLDSASITYLPRKFSLNDCHGRIRFDHKDMYIEDLRASAGSSVLSMNGALKNLFSLIDRNAADLSLNWNISSPRIDLGDFSGFLQKKTASASRKKKKVLFTETISKITAILESCSMRLTLKSKQVLYRKFSATNLDASIDLTNDAIILKNILLDHAGGSLSVSGSVLNLPKSNPVAIRARMNKMDVAKLLTAFNNFGQQGITDKNLKGILTADVQLKGIVTEKAVLIPDSTRGSLDFTLTDGQLVNYEPVEKISKIVFKNRNFSDIQFASLKDRFDILGNNITINRMEIHSSVMTMFVEGIYNMKTGADLSIQVPLSNLKNRKNDSVLVNKGIYSKTGISARLRAKNGEDGKLKISWDPFDKAERRKDKN